MVKWAGITGAEQDFSVLNESLQIVVKLVDQDGYLSVGIDSLSAEGSLYYSKEGWNWDEQAGIFPCLSELSKPGSRSIA
ncbi:MAG: hypothetical protein PHT37_08835 [Candidatus Cloacimonetes bacterium]|nr:hypothetical protein [Candidatus Cloacimonadota bacterium]MDY0324599.1 hypothetical protein [Candidatus Cloacimonadaceae bacterium]